MDNTRNHLAALFAQAAGLFGAAALSRGNTIQFKTEREQRSPETVQAMKSDAALKREYRRVKRKAWATAQRLGQLKQAARVL